MPAMPVTHPEPLSTGPARLRLLPGLPVVRRDGRVLQVGIDPPARAVLPDEPEVRRLVEHLQQGSATPPATGVAARAVEALAAAGLLEDVGSVALAEQRRAAWRVHVEAPADLERPLAAALETAGLRLARPGPSSGTTIAQEDTGSTVALVVRDGEVPRDRLDPLVRDDVPHLLLRTSATEVVVGPFVDPGRTACLRCVDAHHAVEDPRRALVVEQAAAMPAVPRDPVLHPVALAWAVGDVRTWADGGTPSTWSATVHLRPGLEFARRPWRRHPGCGCAWGSGAVG